MKINPVEVIRISQDHEILLKKMQRYLQEAFHIRHFSYRAILKNQRFFQMSSNLDYLTVSIESGLHAKCPFFNAENTSSIPTICVPFLFSNEKHEVLAGIKSLCHKYGMHHPIIFSQFNNNMQETFAFFHESEGEGVINYYFSILPKLYAFIDFFKKNISEVVEEYSQTLILPHYESVLNQEKTKSIFDHLHNGNDLLSIHDNSLLQLFSQEVKLTEREKSILKKALQGKNSKEIADDLYLSFRTVQNNLERIKNKFNCNTLTQLFSLFIDNTVLLKL